MKLNQLFCCVVIGGLLGACATELQEAGEPKGNGSGGSVGSAGSSGNTSSGGSGGSSMAFGGSTGVGGGSAGKGGSAGSTSSGGSSSTGGGAGSSGGSAGSSGGSGGSAGSGTAGTGATGDCAGLQTWTGNSAPDPVLHMGDAIQYMGTKYTVDSSADINWWNNECPPTGTRADWCDGSQKYTAAGACE